jgi:hypothetical protein
VYNHVQNARKYKDTHGHGVKMMVIVKDIVHVKVVEQSFED